MLRILITGPESSGKTTLAKALAAALGGQFHPEYAREYLEERGGKYEWEDLELMLRGQTDQRTNRLVQTNIYDTGPEVYHQWSLVKYGKVAPYINEQITQSAYDFVFLCAPDLPWVSDPLRENPRYADRMALFCTSAGFLLQHSWRFGIIQGENRLQQALNMLKMTRLRRGG